MTLVSFNKQVLSGGCFLGDRVDLGDFSRLQAELFI